MRHRDVWPVNDPQPDGLGYATEAVAELLRICFAELGLRGAATSCLADNTTSRRSMDRLHLRREQHTVRELPHRRATQAPTYP